jgi:hypothetical protein
MRDVIRRLAIGAAFLAGIGIAIPAFAADLVAPNFVQRPITVSHASPAEDFDRDVFFFGGRFHDGYFTQSFIPTANWENNYIVGGGYQQFFSRWGVARFGFEVGAADRFSTDAKPAYGATNSGEVWGGLVTRFDGWDVGPVHITPSLTAGVSVVSGLIGVEAQRNAQPHGDRLSNDGRFLFYLGPEVAFSMPTIDPNLEVFWRAQHRSGGFGSIAELDGSNADVVGVRWKF